MEVLALLAEEASNKAIARRLNISVHTAKFHVGSLLDKLDAVGRTDAVAHAARLGVIHLSDPVAHNNTIHLSESLWLRARMSPSQARSFRRRCLGPSAGEAEPAPAVTRLRSHTGITTRSLLEAYTQSNRQ